MEEHICCICGEKFIGYGNNPYPIKEEGRCCDECNNQVIAERMNNLLKEVSESESEKE